MSGQWRAFPGILMICMGMVVQLWWSHARAIPAHAAEHTGVFQQGLDVYAGVRDTWISALDWDTPPQYSVSYGLSRELILSRDGDDNPLLRFDMSSIPPNSAVASATLSLYNTTASSYSGQHDFPRRIQLFRVLGDWDEGNQSGSPVDQAGKHGATGDNAFDYYPGEGTDIAWHDRGMAADTDYVSVPESFADVVSQGWYTWDVTDLVRAHVRGEQPNFGMVLRDATGYQDDHNDSRSFVSSQSAADPTLRPKLTVVYNPDTPLADAGPDQESFRWRGAAVTLDGSGSHDGPGGNDATLTFSWRVVQAAYGSMMSGKVVSHERVASFVPDRPGEWEIQLTVTNERNETAADTVHLRLLRLRAKHPRIYLTASKLAKLRQRAVPSNPRWEQLLNEANGDGDAESMAAKALVSQVTGTASYCVQAIDAALGLAASPDDWSTKTGDIALIYDWCHGQLSAEQRETFIRYFNEWGNDTPKSEDTPGWGNYWPRYSYSYALMGLATFGESRQARKWLNEYRKNRYERYDLPMLDRIAEGGGWPEGTVYDWIANWPRIKALDAWLTATGENLFMSSEWYRQRPGYILLHRLPGTAEQWGNMFHPYPSTGDAERNRGSMANYERIMALILLERFPKGSLGRQLQAYLAAPPTDNSMSFLFHEEFLWFNPDRPSQAPKKLTHYAAGTGTVFMRSGWPDGAADASSGATYITFQAGDHFTYHQHYDQNSFTLFKHGDLAVDSGVYSGDGLSNHDINYYVRTIAHNTLLVHNPAEDFSSARPDATSNDGGQRTMYPASRSPQTVEYFDRHAVHYDTGDVRRFDDRASYTYVLGDATKAYNNRKYNQAMDAGLESNIAKLTRFQRELVYLRPSAPAGADYVVIFDRVGVTRRAFSGRNTKLLFHTLSQPTVSGTPVSISPGEDLHRNADAATVVSGEGKLFIKTLLPEKRNMRVVGERGVKSFWVFDDNYDWQWSANEEQPRPTNDFESVPYGEWRIELEPGDRALHHNFLTVLHPASADTSSMPTTTLVTGNGVSGAHIADVAMNRVTLFSSANNGRAPAGPITYSYTETARALNLVFDLKPKTRYRIDESVQSGVRTVTLTPDANGSLRVNRQGVARFMLGG